MNDFTNTIKALKNFKQARSWQAHDLHKALFKYYFKQLPKQEQNKIVQATPSLLSIVTAKKLKENALEDLGSVYLREKGRNFTRTISKEPDLSEIENPWSKEGMLLKVGFASLPESGRVYADLLKSLRGFAKGVKANLPVTKEFQSKLDTLPFNFRKKVIDYANRVAEKKGVPGIKVPEVRVVPGRVVEPKRIPVKIPRSYGESVDGTEGWTTRILKSKAK